MQTVTRPRPTSGVVPASPRFVALGLSVLGVGVALVAVLGPLVTGVIEYHVSEGATIQIAGGDAAALGLVAPVALAAAALLRRRPTGGGVLGLAAAVYVLYTYFQLSVGGDVARYQGNSERFFPMFLVLFVLAAWLAARTWSLIEPSNLPSTSRRFDRFIAVVLFTMAAFLAIGLHLPGLIDAWAAEPAAPEYLADPSVFWLVKLMDLGMVVPAMVAIGVGILRQSAWAHKAKYVAVGWFATLGTSVAGMAVLMQLSDDPAASVVNTITFGGFAVLALVLAFVLYRPLLTKRP